MTVTKETYERSGIDLSNVDEWQPLKEIPNIFPQFTIHQINLMAKLREQNGLSPVCKRIGGSKKLYIHMRGFGVFVANC